MNSLLGKNDIEQPGKDAVLSLGIDIGTANVVTLVLDENKNPVTGEIERAHVVRDGMIVEYFYALQIVRKQLETIQRRLGGRELRTVVSAVPPGTEHNNGKVTRNLLESANLEVLSVIDEPSAAAKALHIQDGVVVDVGGGTTGISVLENGEVIYTADESTGGFHVDLVLAGGLGISIEEAEKMKCNKAKQKDLFPVIKPVFEKIITITEKYISDFDPPCIYLVGGTSTFAGFSDLVQKELGIPTVLPPAPLLITPLGMAVACCDINESKR